MKYYTKKLIETKFNCLLDKDKAFDTGTKFWTAFSNINGDIGEYLADGYTLKEIYEQLDLLTKRRTFQKYCKLR